MIRKYFKQIWKKVVPIFLRKHIYRFRLIFIMLSKAMVSPSPILYLFTNFTFAKDGFATVHNIDYLSKNKFLEAFEKSLDGVPEDLREDFKSIIYRNHITTWAANQAINLEGDFVECGVWYGIQSLTILNYLDFSKHDRKFWLLDSWGQEGSHGDYKEDIYKVVEKRFSEFSNAVLIRGLVPQTLHKVESKKIAYLSIDMNGWFPELETLNFFYYKMVRGGVIYFDDYGWDYPDLRSVVDKFFEEKPESILNFPSGNAIVIKV
jgi:hypothetical protein